MKQSTQRFYCFSLFLLLFTFSHVIVAAQELEWQKTEQGKLLIPTGGVWLNDRLFIGATEVTHLNWLEFMYYMDKKDSTKDWTSSAKDLSWNVFPDSILYILDDAELGDRALILRAPFDLEYNEQNRLFLHHPVVGVTYEQALAYTKWKEQIMTEMMNRKLKESGEDVRVLYHCRLPTEKEWEQAVNQSDFKTSFHSFSGRDARRLNKALEAANLDPLDWEQMGKFDFVCKLPLQTADRVALYVDGINVLSKNGEINNTQTYHLVGNVAEMVATKGVAKGGSWLHTAAECRIDARQHYTSPTEWLGFRTITEVYMYQKNDPAPKID